MTSNPVSAPTWLFDLDNTLHNTSAYIFPRINAAMTAYIAEKLQISTEEANALRMHYWRRYGATLLGLMRNHDTDPHHFLYHTHQFPDLHELIVFEREIRTVLHRLPGRKIVVSNGPQAYVEAVLRHMRIDHLFSDIHGVEGLRLRPKPEPQGFRHLLGKLGVRAGQCVLVEDSLENLRTAKALGMRTVWISRAQGRPAYVDVKLRSILDLRRIGLAPRRSF
ncbi:pyrimidine 5'-nucleotidase [Uliginosibacterium sp. H3]|uniref:Pyrimidine 5'-nucleotidase n=1 Tax=Uliginosibacterium silvisoli TaxID=3114758 RepID=A0ABU6K6R1_9RHOO|nr:pyrimidine 5'-nucleotidase [Uliginosibacterium sp. H3]